MKTKICKVHGELTSEQINVCIRNNRSHMQCRACYKAAKKRYRETEKGIKRHKEKHLKRCINLSDNYVKSLLIGNTKIKIDNIDPKLLDLKRILLKIKRKIREKKGN